MKMFIYQIGIFIILVLLLLVCDQNMMVAARMEPRKEKYQDGSRANVYV